MAFEAELVLQGPDDRFDPLTQPAWEGVGRWCRFVVAGWADQQVSQVGGGFFDAGSGEALVTRDRAGPAGGWVDMQQVQGLFTFARGLWDGPG